MTIKKLILMAFILFLVLSCTSIKTINKNSYPNSVSELDTITLGNEKQYILIRGENKNNPIILLVHGGPGNSEMPIMRMATEKLINNYTIVIWDQLGSGKSYSLLKDKKSVTKENIENDCIELIDYLRKRFNKDKIYFIGHSWGTVIGIDTIIRIPEKIAGYIGIGQIVNVIPQEEISYDYTLMKAKEENDKNDIKKLEELGKPINGLYKNRVKDLCTQRMLLLKYGGSLYGKKNYSQVYPILLRFEEYSICDLINYFSGNTLSLDNIWNSDFAKINYFIQAPEVNVPVYFFVGRHDYQTSFELVESYFNVINAPEKELIWFEKSAHSPLYEETDKFVDEVNVCFCK
jgi:proline iminopeptidase